MSTPENTTSPLNKRSCTSLEFPEFSSARGKWEVNKKLRSVLSHPLALPLLHTLHEKNLSNLEYLSRGRSIFCDHESGMSSSTETTNKFTLFDDILVDAVRGEWKQGTCAGDEKDFAKALSTAINDKHNDTNFHSATNKVELHIKARPAKSESASTPDGGCIDILLTPSRRNEGQDSDTESTPLVMMGVGHNHKDWWKKMDQSIKCFEQIGKHQTNSCLRVFDKPLLLVVLTIEGGDATNEVNVKLGIFLCFPENSKKDETSPPNYGISLLCHSDTTGLKEASKEFGRLMRATSDFNHWRDTKQGDSDNDWWSYLGPDCCKVKTKTVDKVRSMWLRRRPSFNVFVYVCDHLCVTAQHSHNTCTFKFLFHNASRCYVCIVGV